MNLFEQHIRILKFLKRETDFRSSKISISSLVGPDSNANHKHYLTCQNLFFVFQSDKRGRQVSKREAQTGAKADL